LQRNDSGAPLPPTGEAEQTQCDKLHDHQPAVVGGEQVRRQDPYQRVDDPADRHRDKAPQRDHRESPRGKVGVLSATEKRG